MSDDSSMDKIKFKPNTLWEPKKEFYTSSKKENNKKKIYHQKSIYTLLYNLKIHQTTSEKNGEIIDFKNEIIKCTWKLLTHSSDK